MSQISHLVAFTAGLLSFVSPCILPLVPAYLANLAGTTAIDVRARTSYRPTLFHSFSFVIGFSLIFVIFGASAGLIGTAIGIHKDLLQKLAGGLVILFGLFLIAALKLPWLNYEKRLSPALGNSPNYLRSFLIGAAFALSWTPCVGPILGGILTLAASSETVLEGASLLAVYSLGLGIPFIMVGLAWGIAAPFWKSLNRHLGAVSVLSGLLLVAVGVLMLTGNLIWLNKYFGF